MLTKFATCIFLTLILAACTDPQINYDVMEELHGTPDFIPHYADAPDQPFRAGSTSGPSKVTPEDIGDPHVPADP